MRMADPTKQATPAPDLHGPAPPRGRVRPRPVRPRALRRRARDRPPNNRSGGQPIRPRSRRSLARRPRSRSAPDRPVALGLTPRRRPGPPPWSRRRSRRVRSRPRQELRRLSPSRPHRPVKRRREARQRSRPSSRTTSTRVAGKGAPLPDAVRKEFEAKFQRPFDDVRIHDDAAADDAARRIDALAFTRGNDIYFRSGAYDPTTQKAGSCSRTKLAHVVQQRPGVNRKSAPGLGGALISRATNTPAAAEATDESRGLPRARQSSDSIKITNLGVPKLKKGRSRDGPFVVTQGVRERRTPTLSGIRCARQGWPK